ncbi:hypothetical protein [Pseudomonas syringae]|uniref:Uncharacterized protein n=1 Tax=Pseudomonas syringae pv. daphniphylli TaxID=264455 RepID=A0A9X0H226_PSESX|nr:hypothetical protein [Pseudomonas syringae]KPX09685.1 Uncharacterized protein ALO73_01808 [Pseudomonas syringae pv. daphniphylli]KWS87377.1 hypothetical protein AL050_24290 [Pseudomonas syringae pv. daphniphylli]
MDMKKRAAVLLSALLVQGCQSLRSADAGGISVMASVATIPYAERAIPAEQAKRFFDVAATDTVLEGPSFDRAGNLVFSDVRGQRLLRLSTSGVLSEVRKFDHGNPGGTAIHRDGRIYVAVIADQFARGWIV